jgi:hypothetical protein
MTDLLQLADRCEKATGPDRQLDADIFTALKLVPDRKHDGYPFYAFTQSLDAAMTLVPEGEDWAVGSGPLFPTSARVAGKPAVQAATPALALCAASLRAKANG